MALVPSHRWQRELDGKTHTIEGRIYDAGQPPVNVIILALGAKYYIGDTMTKRFVDTHFNFCSDYWTMVE